MEGIVKKQEYHAIFRTVMNEIAETLQQSYDLVVSDSFIVIMVKLVTLNPENRFILVQPAMRDEMTRLRKATVEFILAMTPIQRNIIRMQLHYRSNHFVREELIQAHQVDLDNTVNDLMQDLTQNVPKHYKEAELYYKKLVATIIGKLDMGPAADNQVVKETEAALESVFPQEELSMFHGMSPAEREHEIKQLILMTGGIRLYNRESEPGAHDAGIEDVLTILPDKIYRCATILSELREKNIQRLIRYTVLVQPYFMTNSSKSGRRDISRDMLLTRQGLVMIHQLLVYIKELSDELTLEDEVCDANTKDYNETHKTINESIRDQSTVPTFVVYPKFLALAESWKKLQDSLVFMDSLSELIKALVEMSEADLLQLDPLVDKLTSSMRIPDETTFFAFPRDELSENTFALATKSDFLPHMDPLSMMYSGFCVWSLVKGIGLVLLANPNLGVFTWRDKQFLLASVEAAEEFRREPDMYILQSIMIARRWPELIFLLKMENQVFNPDTPTFYDVGLENAVAARVNQDSAVQTEIHPVESNIVPGYTWNEWEYRRRAVLLARLYKCVTHSTQTYKLGLRKYVPTQTYPKKNAKVQTKQDVASEIPMSQFYFWGLRGCHPHPPHIVELSRDAPLGLRCFAPTPKPPKKHHCI